MIIGLWHPGSGVGDQLFCYLAARITAERLGVSFGMVGEFKGESFLKLDKGAEVIYAHHVEMPAGKIVMNHGWPVYEGKTYYDPEFNFIEDMTIVDGCRCQDERYWLDYSASVSEWFATEPINVPDDVCIIGFRGGEYATVPDLFLTKHYWDKALLIMSMTSPTIRFQVHTDDVVLAKKFFPDYEIVHDVGLNWQTIRYAKYAIIANSAFYILPRLLKHKEVVAMTLAPRYWARRNIKEWSTPQNYYPSFTYL